MRLYTLFKIAFFPFATAAFLTSCLSPVYVSDPYIVEEDRQKANFYYVPRSPNTPLSKDKNDISLKLQYAGNLTYNGLDVQAAYLPSKHFGLTFGMTNGENKEKKVNDLDYNYNYTYSGILKNRDAELGAGYITSINQLLHFETYAGYGSGKITNAHHTGLSVIRNQRFFLQPAIVLKDKNVLFSFVSRFTRNDFNVLNSNFDNAREPFVAGQFKMLSDEPVHYFWEPGIIFRAGAEQLQVTAGYSLSTDLTNSNLHMPKGTFFLGWNVKLNVAKKKKSSVHAGCKLKPGHNTEGVSQSNG